jgi:hypothetical protein
MRTIIYVAKTEGKRPVGRVGIDESILLKWNLRKYGSGVWFGFFWPRIGPVVGCCEHNNETSDSTKDGEFLNYLRVLLSSQRGLYTM